MTAELLHKAAAEREEHGAASEKSSGTVSLKFGLT